MAGLRERKKLATRIAIRDAAMALFAERGFAGTTMDQIADAADVSRATVFTYFPTKEDIVFGDGPQAVAALGATLAEAAGGEGTLEAVRAWLRELTGWMEPALAEQLRLAREVPAVAAARMRVHRDIQRVAADGLEAELGPDRRLAAQLAAASLVAGLGIAEEAAVARMEEGGRALTGEEIDGLLDDAVRFAQAGMAAIGPG
jgi:AcrR family transcriptional regulator